MTNEITLTDEGGNVVRIMTTNVSETFNNEMKSISLPKTSASESEGASTLLINLLQVKRVFTIDGYIGAYSTDTAAQQRTKLRDMNLKTTKGITMTYDELTGDNALTVSITKCDITEKPDDPDPDTGVTNTTIPLKIYAVKILVIDGKNYNDRS